MPAPSIFSADWRNELLRWLTAAFQPLAANLTSWAGVTRAAGFDTFTATPSSANLRALLTDETGTGAAYFQGGALGTPSSGTLTNCTGLPNASVIGLGTAALKNTGTSGSNIPLLDGANSWSDTQTISSNNQGLQIFSYTSGAATSGPIIAGRARGTVSSPSAVLNGDTIAGLQARGYGATGFSTLGRASVTFRAIEDWSDAAQGCEAIIETTGAGTTTRTVRLSVQSGLVMTGATGGDKGVGTINATGNYINGVLISPPGAPVTKTADFTVAATESNLINNKSGSTCTVTLPAAASFPGREILIKNSQAQTVVSASSNVVPRVTAAAGTAILASGNGNWAKLVSDGTNWIIMAGS